MIEPCALTIGNFDGVHLGHQAVIERLLLSSGKRIIYTFSNHPIEVLRQEPVRRLCSLPHRLSLLETFGIDQIVTIPFTRAFSEQSPEDFLAKLREKIPFTHLILGHDARIGRNREGNFSSLQKLAPKMRFTLEHVSPFVLQGAPVSSSRIRLALGGGDFALAELLLGRPYSICGIVERGFQRGEAIGYRTANLPVDGLCLPPQGVYCVEVLHNDQSHIGVANLGQAPTIHAERRPLLETHLIDFNEDLYDCTIEVIFRQFLRPERRFDSIEQLRAQIALDILASRGRLQKSGGRERLPSKFP